MEKTALKCDVCGGPLTMGEGGAFATCEYCGMKYAIERLREKIQGSVTIEGEVKTTRADFEIEAGVLKKYNGKETTVVVPDDVKAIGDSCFEGMSYLESVTLPEGLVEIGSAAFRGCKSLPEIKLPGSLVSIKGSAFRGCESLREIKLPEGLVEIWGTAFGGCKSLREVVLPKALKVVDGFEGCTSLTEITLPEGLVEIKDEAFYGCTSLTKINIPDSVDKIGTRAFGGCGNLRNVVISIGELARRAPEPSLYWRWDAFESYSTDKVKAPWYLNLQQNKIAEKMAIWMSMKRCRHCGGEFEGLIFKECTECHKKKDY